MSKIGVIISNVGTPQSSDTKGVKDYLIEFLMDPFVIHIPYFIRFILFRLIIIPIRSPQSALNYQKIWKKEGSPLLVETKKVVKALQKKLGEDFQVVVAMRYGLPKYSHAKVELKACEKIVLFQQYPQYAESTVKTGLLEFHKNFSDKKTFIIEPYFEDPLFIKVYVEFLKKKLITEKGQHLLMSFHGLPETHVKRVDPTKNHCLKKENCCDHPSPDVLKNCYRAQCLRTAEKIASGLGLSKDQYTVSFQSRVGKFKWIGPSTIETLEAFPEKGIKNLQVICPGFSVDGLETLEEIAQAGRELFMEKGGTSYEFVPCLNDDPLWIDACATMVKNIIS